jgi:xylan 1,4-beta-xylosidase
MLKGSSLQDPYTTYLEKGSPYQLTIQQVQTIKQKNGGAPVIKKTIVVGANKTFRETLDLRENDVVLIMINRL